MYHDHSRDNLCKVDNAHEPRVWMLDNPAPADLIFHPGGCYQPDDHRVLLSIIKQALQSKFLVTAKGWQWQALLEPFCQPLIFTCVLFILGLSCFAVNLCFTLYLSTVCQCTVNNGFVMFQLSTFILSFSICPLSYDFGCQPLLCTFLLCTVYYCTVLCTALVYILGLSSLAVNLSIVYCVLEYYAIHWCTKGRRPNKKTSYSVTLSLLPLTPSLPRLKVTCLISDKVVFWEPPPSQLKQ